MAIFFHTNVTTRNQ